MKSLYERKQYIIGSGLISISLLLVCLIVMRIVIGYGWGETLAVMVVIFAGLAAIVIFGYKMLDRAYNDMEKVSGEMIDVVEGDGELAEEEYCQGTTGILYTNFYKMVSYLRESKQREMDEKIFLRDIISDISHQLKTPLASLNVFVDLLLDDKVAEPEKRKQMLKESKNQLDRMEWMVLSLLKLARIEAGAIQFERTPGNVKLICDQAAESVRYLTDKRNQNVNVICDDDAELVCDGEWLTEALINLLKNASDYSPENTSITIEVENNDLFTRIHVRDHGMGIPEKELANVFKRFYRVHKEVNPNSVGIGLSLTKSIVEGMGGSISVRSVEGEYTCFALTFVR